MRMILIFRGYNPRTGIIIIPESLIFHGSNPKTDIGSA